MARWRTRSRPHLARAGAVVIGVALLGAATVVALNSPRLALQALPLGRSLGPGSSDVGMRFERADRLAPGAEVRYGARLGGRVDTVGPGGRGAAAGGRLGAEAGAGAA